MVKAKTTERRKKRTLQNVSESGSTRRRTEEDSPKAADDPTESMRKKTRANDDPKGKGNGGPKSMDDPSSPEELTNRAFDSPKANDDPTDNGRPEAKSSASREATPQKRQGLPRLIVAGWRRAALYSSQNLRISRRREIGRSREAQPRRNKTAAGDPSRPTKHLVKEKMRQIRRRTGGSRSWSSEL